MPGMITSSYIDTTTGRETPQSGTGGGPNLIMKGGTWDYGNWPQNRYDPSTVTLTASANDTLVYESVDARAYNGFIFEVSALAGTTPSIRLDVGLLDDTSYALTRPRIINLADGAAVLGATGVTAVGIYALEMPSNAKVKYRRIRLKIFGGLADLTTTVRYAHVWA